MKTVFSEGAWNTAYLIGEVHECIGQLFNQGRARTRRAGLVASSDHIPFDQLKLLLQQRLDGIRHHPDFAEAPDFPSDATLLAVLQAAVPEWGTRVSLIDTGFILHIDVPPLAPLRRG